MGLCDLHVSSTPSRGFRDQLRFLGYARAFGGNVAGLIRKMAVGASLLIGCLITAWLVFPATTAAALIYMNNASAGLTAKVVSTELGEVHYLEGGQGETVLLVHGIYARKEHWVELARALVKDHHVIALDLPGFGDNAPLADDQYLLSRQRAHLLFVMDALDLERVHIGANSMGAYVSTLLAHAHPEKVASFAYIGSPLGVPTPVQSDMDAARAAGGRPLVVQSFEDFTARNDWLSPNIPYVPGPILRTWAAEEVATGDHNARVWDVVHQQSDVPTVLELAPSLSMPSLILWCQEDRIFHVSGAEVLRQTLPNAQMTVLEGCGHVPMLDRPDAVAERYLEFLATLPAE